MLTRNLKSSIEGSRSRPEVNGSEGERGTAGD